MLDPAESTFLIGQPKQKKRNEDEKMQQDNLLTYTLGSKDIVERAIKKKPITDVYDLKYLMEVVGRQECKQNRTFRD